MTPGAIEGGKCASVRDKTKRTLDLSDASFGRGSKRIMAPPSARRELASKPSAHMRAILRTSASRNAPFGKGLLQVFFDSVAFECILSQVGKRVDHTPSRIVVAAVPVGISSQH